MQFVLEQERLFFELTKVIMNERDTQQINYEMMSRNTKSAYEYMFKLLTIHSEDRLLHAYMQTCKIEVLVH